MLPALRYDRILATEKARVDRGARFAVSPCRLHPITQELFASSSVAVE